MKEIGRFFKNLFAFLIAALVGAAGLMFVVSDNFGWSYRDSFSVMIGIFVGCMVYQVYDEYTDYQRSQYALADARERQQKAFE